MPKKPKKWAKVTPGHLYGWKKTQADQTRRTLLNKLVKKDSYATVIRRLNQLRNLTKDPKTKSVAKKDMEYLKKKHDA
ncbi:MAG: hypothetical protein QF824_02165 [Candidatus Woesearchaeota archaeon]|jgi:hypothetical protein|nr:hypothetical protein [Candidatus Woesearchaeota archaeon]